VSIRSGLALLLILPAAHAAELKQETLNAWDDYIRTANSRMQDRVSTNVPFLWVDGSPDRLRQVRAGEILVTAVGERTPRRIPSGLIHHWMGVAFIPGAKIDNVFDVVRNYGRYKEFYNPVVMDSKTVNQSASLDKFSVLLMNKAFLSKSALDSEFESFYTQVDGKRWYGVAASTQVQEIHGYGQSGEHRLPPNEGSGYIWRLYSIMRFEERDGGVYLEVEAMALSREIPASLHWLVDPIVQRVSKGSLTTSLRQTQEAVTGDVVSRVAKMPSTQVRRVQSFVP
jgi:hypothetical protein